MKPAPSGRFGAKDRIPLKSRPDVPSAAMADGPGSRNGPRRRPARRRARGPAAAGPDGTAPRADARPARRALGRVRPHGPAAVRPAPRLHRPQPRPGPLRGERRVRDRRRPLADRLPRMGPRGPRPPARLRLPVHPRPVVGPVQHERPQGRRADLRATHLLQPHGQYDHARRRPADADRHDAVRKHATAPAGRVLRPAQSVLLHAAAVRQLRPLPRRRGLQADGLAGQGDAGV